MTPNPTIMQAVEQLNYRMTLGDVATKAGLELNQAEQGLLALASEAGGHLQVAETGDIVYQFPKNFRAILRNKYWKLRFQEWWEKVWGILFYLIRISFGTILIASIVLIAVSIVVILVVASSSRDGEGNSRDRGGGGFVYFPLRWFSDLFWLYSWDYGRYDRRPYPRQKPTKNSQKSEMNFLEAVFSFLFGDGNPNAEKEERRWQSIGTVIRENRGAVVAEQISPYLDELGNEFARDYEEYMLPVLTRFNGRPEVSPEGELVYHFPELQTTAGEQNTSSVSAYFKEFLWRFSRATSNQLMLAAGLGALNIILALILGSLLGDGTIAREIGGLVLFVQSIYWLLLGYGTAFLTIPLVRYFWIQWRNVKIEGRNQQRQERAIALNQSSPQLQQKVEYARQFSAQTVISEEDLVYTTETDLTQQELERSDKIDEEWRRRLESGS